MSRIQIDHIAIAVTNLEQSLEFWQHTLGLTLTGTEHNPHEGVDIAFLDVGGARIELLQPLDDANSIGKFIAKRGTGIHHLCLAVSDIHSALNTLKAQGVELINDVPKQREDGTQYAFVHPKSTGGVLLELYQYAEGKS